MAATRADSRCRQMIGRCQWMRGRCVDAIRTERGGFEYHGVDVADVMGNKLLVSGGEASNFSTKYVGKSRLCPLDQTGPFLPFFVPGFYIRDLCRKCTGIFRT